MAEKKQSRRAEMRSAAPDAQTKTKELEDLLKRVQADFDNFRKRTEKERTEITQFANASLITELLPVLDNFKRAAQHVPTELQSSSWVTGVKVIERQVEETLRQHGLTPIEVKPGDQFDANLHEAVSAEDKETGKLGTVSEVLQQGYLLSGKVLRPAKVVVN